MRAVNLIPKDERAGAGGAAGRSAGAVYILLGALAVLVVMVGSLAVASRTISDKKADLAQIEAEAQATEAKAASLREYANFRKLRETRAATVRSIAASRFDWSFAMHELARTIPGNVWLTAVTGTVDPGVPIKGKAVSVQLRAAKGVPAVELQGCTTNQASVAKMMSAMRRIDGVRRVSLESAKKIDNPRPEQGSGAGGAGSDCRHGDARYPQFLMAVFFDAKAAPAAAPAVGAAATSTTPTPATP